MQEIRSEIGKNRSKNLSVIEDENSRRLEEIIKGMDMVLLTFDREWRNTYLNDKAVELLKKPRAEVAGRTIWELFPEIAGTGNEAEFYKVMEQGVSARFETYNPSLGKWYDIYAYPVTEGLAIQASDITERKKAEEALREREQRLRAMFDNAAIGIIEADAENRFIAVNDRLCKILGYSREELLGKTISDLTAPEDRARSDEMNARLQKGEMNMFDYEKKYLKRDGTPLWVHVTVSAIRDAAGRHVSSIGTVDDISERKQVEVAIRESEERFRAMADNISQFAWMADADGWIFWYNKRWYEYTGTMLEEMKGWGWQKVHHPEHVKRVVEKFSHHLKTGEIWEDTFPLRSKTGEYRWFLSRAVPIRNAQGTVTRWFGTNTDITDLKQAQENLQNSNQELEQFAYVASHDLQEPLRMVASFTDLLAQKYGSHFDEKGKRYMHYVVDGAERMQRLIQDLLTFSRVGRLNTERSRVDSSQVVENVIAGMGDIIRETAAVVSYDKLPVVTVNQTNLIQLFQNLIGNALKFRRKDVPPRIRIEAHRKNNGWVFSVEDNGIGIEREYFDRIFVIFQRLHSRNEYPGTGIGLSICKKIVETYGGKIWVEAEPGQGSTFYFTLPQ